MNRLLQINISSLDAPLVGVRLLGTDYISWPFEFQIDVLIQSDEALYEKLLHKTVSITIQSHGLSRVYHGIICRSSMGERLADGWQEYRFTLCPWLRLLARNKDSRVYAAAAKQSIPDIVTAVFQSAGFNDFRWRLHRDYPALSVSVQYNETPFNYISRLLRRAGIHYYFEHTVDKHTMILSDSKHPLLSASELDAVVHSANKTAAHVARWGHFISLQAQRAQTQLRTLEQPNTIQASEQEVPKSKTRGAPLNDYHYGAQHPDDDAAAQNARLERELQGRALCGDYHYGLGSYCDWQAGTSVKVNDQRYYVAAIVHRAIDTSAGVARDYFNHSAEREHIMQYAGVIKGTVPAYNPDEHNIPKTSHYDNQALLYRHDQPFVPEGLAADDIQAVFTRYLTSSQDEFFEPIGSTVPPITEPNLFGLYKAVVTGPPGQPIYTDEYGRVKVKFEFDHYSTENETSFTWVPVRQAWGGDQYGLHFTPRVGQTVLVTFDHGNPDRPYIIGSLPSEQGGLPFTPEKTPTHSGFHSQSLDPEAPAPGGHQVVFEDDAKQPFVKLHAQRDMQLHTAKNYTETIQGNSTTTVTNGNHTQTVDGKVTIRANKAVHLVCGQSRVTVTDTDIILEADTIHFGGQGFTTPKTPLSCTAANVSTPTSEQPDTDNNTSPLEEAFPAVSLDLSLIKPMTGLIVFDGKPFTYTTELSGNVTLQKQGTHPVGELSVDGYKVEAKNTLGNFFSSMTLHPNNHEQFVLGSQVTGDFVTTKFTVLPLHKIHFESNPAPLSKIFSGWKIEGDLMFSVDLSDQQALLSPPIVVKSPLENTLIKEWHAIKESVLISGVVVIGSKLASLIEDLEPIVLLMA